MYVGALIIRIGFWSSLLLLVLSLLYEILPPPNRILIIKAPTPTLQDSGVSHSEGAAVLEVVDVRLNPRTSRGGVGGGGRGFRYYDESSVV